MMNIQKWLKKSIQKLSHLNNPKYEAELLLCYISKLSKSKILSSDFITLSELELKLLNNLVDRRAFGEPMAYILGKKEFWSLSFHVSYDTLIPRPDTEILVEQVLLKIKNKSYYILDLGCGCGAISLSLAITRPNCFIIGIDNSKKAIDIARFNLSLLKLQNISFFYSNWFSHIHTKFNVIVSNPPYISRKEFNILKRDLFFEPKCALVSSDNGFADIKFIIKHAHIYLYDKGWLFIEHGWKQKKIVQDYFKRFNFLNIESFKDYGGNDRVTIGQKNVCNNDDIL